MGIYGWLPVGEGLAIIYFASATVAKGLHEFLGSILSLLESPLN